MESVFFGDEENNKGVSRCCKYRQQPAKESEPTFHLYSVSQWDSLVAKEEHLMLRSIN